MVRRIKRAIDVSPDTLAFDLIKAVGPGGHFLDKDHTFDHFRTEFFQPHLSNRDDFVVWQTKGSPQSAEKAHQRVGEILETYEAPQLLSYRITHQPAYLPRQRHNYLPWRLPSRLPRQLPSYLPIPYASSHPSTSLSPSVWLDEPVHLSSYTSYFSVHMPT